MNNFLASIMDSSGYNLIENTKLKLFGNGYEFFLIQNFEVKEFEKFFNSDSLDDLISKFQELKDDKIQKNTSLFVLVKVNDMHGFYNQFLNTTVTIEEDEYYFRKYVIFYTEEGLEKLEPSVQYLLDYIQNNEGDSGGENLFDKFERNMFFDDTYFIAMQLIIKLPFISLPHSGDHFEIIDDKIKSRIHSLGLVKKEKQVDEILELFHDDNIGSQLEDTTIIDGLRHILEDLVCENKEDFTL
ncbi:MULTISPECIES: ABC-three component system middle component 1 [unclassified Streptococcus]|uniref:ABC-three component system middle component 1 n=1 Tax=unclassified Streptococcus TaxID=2608887 RepID=UPI00359EF042